MTNEEKLKAIRPWIDPEERVTVSFLDEQGLNAEVTGCNDELVDLSLETRTLHIKQHISVPLRRAELHRAIQGAVPLPPGGLRQAVG